MKPTPLELLLSGRFQELLARMANPGVRGQLLAEVAGSLDTPEGFEAGPALLEQRQLSLLAAGDWSWGILTPRQRRAFLVRDACLLCGAGTADNGAAQYAALGRLKSELGNLYDSLNLALEEGDLSWLLPLAEHLASILEFSSEFTSMHERYSALLEAALRLRNPRLEVHARLGLSLALSHLGRYAEAQAEAASGAALATRLGDGKLQAAALHLGGSAQALAGGYLGARDLLTQALALRRRLAERHGIVATMSNLAYVEEYTGHRSASRALLEEALGLCRELGDRRGEAMFLQNLGALEFNAGDYSQARALGQQALSIYRELGERRGAANTLSAVGFAEYGAGNLALAGELHAEALALSRELGDRYGESLALLALGNLASLTGGHALAAEHYTLALQICLDSGDRPGEARARCGLANAGLLAGRAAEAAAELAQALRIFSAIGEEPGIVDCLAYAAGLLANPSFKDASPAAAGVLEAAAVALAGARWHAQRLEHHFDPLDQHILAQAQRDLDAALAAGRLSSAKYERLATVAVALELAEHAARVMAVLQPA